MVLIPPSKFLEKVLRKNINVLHRYWLNGKTFHDISVNTFIVVTELNTVNV